jgi:hypothetical protein
MCGIGICVGVAGGVGICANSALLIFPEYETSVLDSDIGFASSSSAFNSDHAI